MKKSLVLALAASLAVGVATTSFAATFSDTAGVDSWAGKQITKLNDMKVLEGYNGKFNPNSNVTRAEFAKIIVNAKGLQTVTPAKATFPDVASDKWYFGYVEAAAKAGYIAGDEKGNFNPDKNITRQEIAKIIVLAAGKTADTTKALNFDDKAQIADWAKGYVAVAADAKLIQGYNGKFDPTANATRAQAAVLAYNELVYEGKITQPIASDLITDVKYKDTYGNIVDKVDGVDPQYTISALTVGGKRYEVDAKATVTIDGTEVNGYAVRQNTHATITTDSDDVVTKIELSSADYKLVKAKVEALGQSGATTFAVINGTKVNYSKVASNYASVNSDVELIDRAEPQVGKTYIYFVDDRGFGYYFQNIDDATVKGTVEYVGKDSKVYIYVNGQKYTVDETTTSAKFTPVDGAEMEWADVSGKYLEFSLGTDNYVDVDTVKVDNVLSGYVAEKPILVGNADDGWNVYVKVVDEATNNEYNSANYFWVNYDSSLDFIEDSDVQNHALKFDTVADAKAAGYDVDHNLKSLEKYSGITVNGATKDLSQVAKRSFVVVKFKEAGKYNAADFFSACAAGRVEKITKDGNNNVTKVTIGGTEFTYVGQTAEDTKSDEGKVWFAGKNDVDKLEVDDLVTAALNKDGQLVTIISIYNNNTINDATVTAVGGEKSIMSKTSSDADAIYVPANTIEVKYDDNGTKVAWLNYAWMSGKDKDGVAIAGFKSKTDADTDYDDEEVGLTGVFKANAGVAFSSIKKGDVIDFDTLSAVAKTGKEGGAPKFLFVAGTSESFTDADYDFAANFTAGSTTGLGGSHFFTAAAYGTSDDTTTGDANWTFSSTPALFINVR